MRNHKNTGISLMIIGSLFLLILLPFSVFSQDNFTAEEIAYQEMFNQVLASEMPDTLKLIFLKDSIHNLDYHISQLPFIYAKKGIRLAEKINNSYWKGTMEYIIGRYYCNTSKSDSSSFILEKALLDFKAAKRDDLLAKTHGLIRYVYSVLGQHERSLQHCYSALEIYKRINDEEGIGITYNDFAGTLIIAGNHSDALPYTIKGREILLKYDNPFELNAVTDKMITCQMELGDYDACLVSLKEVVANAVENLDVVGKETVTVYYVALYRLYLVREELDLALEAINSARYYVSHQKEHLYHNTFNLYEADILFKQQKFEEAKRKYLAVQDEENKHERDNIEVQYMNNLAHTFAVSENYDSAYLFQMKYIKAYEENNSHESILKMEELKTQYQTEQKEATIAAQEAQLTQQKMIQWLALGFAGVLGLLFFQSYRNAQSRKKNNKALEKTNTLLEVKNQENEVLLKEIHHRVKNNLQTISSLLSLQSESIEDKTALDAVKSSKNRVASIALIHEKLYQGKNLAAVEMRDYFESIANAILESFGIKADNVELEIKMPQLELDVETAIPIGLITNELITNSLKYAFKEKDNGKISIHLEKGADNLIQLIISDNGTFDNSSAAKKDGTGFGTLLVELLTTQLGGQLEKSTTDGTTTKILFHTPNSNAA